MNASRKKLRWAGKSKSKRRTRTAAQPAAAVVEVEATSQESIAEAALAIGAACSSVANGLEVCAARTRNATVAIAARSARDFVRQITEDVAAVVAAQGTDGLPRARTGDRLRWEWLASTATVLDGTSDSRLLFECAATLASAFGPAARLRAVDASLVSRLRSASAEAYSLASTSQLERRHDMLLALTLI